ncbi:MAG: ABC transporter ATP-binding protein [Eubacteriaceae bacterium]|nr:ABC transporter ATP-binding protein [Eubacteriaceae bacterium]
MSPALEELFEGRSADTVIDIRDLWVEYQSDLETVKAVNGIDLTIKRGRTFGLVGETGAGKTTTALSILRLLPAATGRIVRGEIVFNGKDLLSLDENLMQAARGNLVSMVGIMPQRKVEFPHQFSGGMKQRVVIAMALSCEPELLIADEPTTALDVTIQAQVLAMIKELRDRLGTSMLMITHDLGIVAQTCDDVGVMYAGEIVETGSVEDIFEGDKHHPYTTGLFDSIPDLSSRAERLKPIPGLMPDPTNLPEGCYFAERCPFAEDICTKKHPSAYVEGSHRILCHRFTREGKDE